MRQKYSYLLICILLIKAVLMICWIQFSSLQLAPDEAQYWTWSQYIDWGYYSKPPAIAWEIWLGTKLFGDTVLGVRIGAVVLSFLISLSVYWLAVSAGLKERTAFWAGLISALSPMGFFASYYATTDVGMVLFWILSCLVVVKALHSQTRPHYLLLGLLVGFGALFKWPIYLIWVLVFCTMIVISVLRSWWIIPGVFISLLGLLPTIVWNAERGWPTFQHVWTTMLGGSAVVKKTALFQGNFFDFLGAQAALISPIFFVLLLIAFVTLFRKWRKVPLPIKFCGIVSFLILLVYQTLSLFQKMQGNWCVFVYPTATVFLVWYLCEFVSWGRKWLYVGLSVSLLLVGLIFSIPMGQMYNWGPMIAPKLNRLNECMGWNHIAAGLEDVDYDPDKQFLVSDTYQMSSLLSFYAPGQKRAYFLNLEGRRKNQFSYWPSLADERLGQSGFFVAYVEIPMKETTEERYQTALEPYFKNVRYLGMAPLLYAYGELRKVMLIYYCEDYNGSSPEDANIY
ncbi:MAG: Undecaprenyl phosphate-alpha-4-amino-4-deoxy-L-arabinose arabinosyl transferase [Chlamydiae bacterium]|nr:Undecaprenyl phosphate-alpha-4-amino-4-deoxy-L-arabinose arabinosyl transferase [Chlamydiota bacterium]